MSKSAADNDNEFYRRTILPGASAADKDTVIVAADSIETYKKYETNHSGVK